MLRHKQAEELKVGIDINSLPLSAQIQVRAKLDEQKREQNQQRTKKQSEAQKRQKQPKEADSAEPSKYRNVKVFRVVDTGVTRAKQNVALIGQTEALNTAILNNQTDVRHTLLGDRLHAAFTVKS